MSLDTRILSPLRDPSFWTAVGASAAAEAGVYSTSSGTVLVAGMLAGMLPLLQWLSAHAKHRKGALDAAVQLAQLAAAQEPVEAPAETPAAEPSV